MQLGVVGLGRMGAGMARRLARAAPQAWEATDEHFKMLFELE